MQNKLIYMKGFCARFRFETEAKSNSEIERSITRMSCTPPRNYNFIQKDSRYLHCAVLRNFEALAKGNQCWFHDDVTSIILVIRQH